MKKIISSLPDQILEAISLVSDISHKRKKYSKVLICGMGGSGISGDLIKTIYPHIEIISNKDYSIPKFIDNNTLSILVSYSGNTEETLNNYKILSRVKTTKITISSDGALLRKKSELKIKVPGGLPPRGALGYLFTPIPIVLYNYGLIKTDPIPKLVSLAMFLKKKRDNIEKKAIDLSKKFLNKLPLIYSNSQTLLPAASRWQCQLNENSKILAHINVIPEMNHNEIVGLGRPKRINKEMVVAFLNDPKAHPRSKMRVKIVKSIIKNKFGNVVDINPEGKSALMRLFWTIMLGDFLSYYCAINTNVDPLPVKRIDFLKKQLSKFR